MGGSRAAEFPAGSSFLITGAASGIGMATARLLHERQARLVLWDVNADALASLGGELAATTRVVDVTGADAVMAATADAAEELDGISGVIHCAGIMRTGHFTDVPISWHEAVIDVNFLGTVLVAHAAIPHLRRSGGSLVLMGSASAFFGPPEFATYGATKAAVLSLGQALRIELEELGIHVGVCNPLFVDSPMVHSQEHEAAFVRSEGFAHSPDEVARALVASLSRRQFMIWPGWPPRRVHLMSRMLDPVAHRLMRRAWSKGRR